MLRSPKPWQRRDTAEANDCSRHGKWHSSLSIWGNPDVFLKRPDVWIETPRRFKKTLGAFQLYQSKTSLFRQFLRQPIAIIPFRILIRNIRCLAFLHGNKATATRIVLKRRYPRLTQMSELHFLHMYSGNTPCPVTFYGDTEIGLVEESCGAADVIHRRDGELFGERVAFHLGGVSG